MKMDSLFDKLKSEPAANAQPKSKHRSGMSKPVPNEVQEDKAVRRESMPPPNTSTVIKSSPSKSRSLSPPKSAIKSLKVRVERAKLDAHLLKNIQESAAAKKCVETSNVLPKKAIDHTRSPAKKTQQETAPKVVTPTKAQQKLFDPEVLVKAHQLTNMKLKRCLVRLPRINLQKLQEDMRIKMGKTSEEKTNSQKSTVSVDYGSNKGKKRKSNSGSSSAETSPNKKGKRTSDGLESKPTTGFFIKINDLTKTPSKSVKKLKEKKYKAACAKYHQNIIVPTKPTKFSRSQLIKQYGNHFFNSHVRIKRCKHPMMLIFESNARARNLQSKKNKSKNLNVSFCDQVEILGGSSESEHEASQVEEPVSNLKNSVRGTMSPLSSNLLTVTPARLKKVENGKVVDDIELDTSLFMLPAAGAASTPFVAPTQKRREKKSFSPLKGDGIPSPRKEKFKLANEKMPPSVLRRLPPEDADDEDEEDDECEYIVPIDFPERRTSRTSSANAAEEIMLVQNAQQSPIAEIMEHLTKPDTPVETQVSSVEQPTSEKLTNGENGSNGIVSNTSKDENNDELSPLTRLGSISPAHSLSSLNDLVDSLINNVAECESRAGGSITNAAKDTDKANGGNTKDVPETQPESGSKIKESIEEMPLQLFVEDDSNLTNNSNFLQDNVLQEHDFVDGIKQRIDEMTATSQKAELTTDVVE